MNTRLLLSKFLSSRSMSNLHKASHTSQVWSTKSVEGVHRFLARSYRLVTGDNVRDAQPTKDQLRLLHATIKRVCFRINLLEDDFLQCDGVLTIS